MAKGIVHHHGYLQRKGGFKRFHRKSVSVIIAATDPLKQEPAQVGVADSGQVPSSGDKAALEFCHSEPASSPVIPNRRSAVRELTNVVGH